MRMSARKAAKLGAAGSIAVSVALFAAVAAQATTVSLPGNASVASGSTRSIGAAWGSSAPYNVNFQCGQSGCANFVTSSTTTTSLGRTLPIVNTCTGESHTATLKVTEHAGNLATASTTTTWRKGLACR